MENNKISKGKMVAISVVSIILVVAIIVGVVALSQYFDVSENVIEKVDTGYYESALSLYQEGFNEKKLDKLEEAITKRISVLQEGVKGDSISYDDAMAELEILREMNVVETLPKINNAESYIKSLNESRAAFDLAKEYENKSNYENAISEYKKVIEDDANYETAKTNMQKVVEKYRAEILDKAKVSVADGDYKTALKSLNKALNILSDDSEISKQIALYKSEIQKKSIEDADKLIKDKKYTDAKNLLYDAINILGGDNTLQVKLNGIDDLRPVDLDTLFVIDSKYYEYLDSPVTDSFGNDYSCAHEFRSLSYDSYAIYNLNKEYSELTGSIVLPQNIDPESKVSISIYVDDKLEYSKAGITKFTDKVNFSVSVKGGKMLKIVAKTTSGYSNDKCYLIDVGLSKQI